MRWAMTWITGVTAKPDAEWVARQARSAYMEMAEWGLPARPLVLDHNREFSSGCDAVF